MGNRQPNYNHKIGKSTAECPICGLKFRATDTYGHVNAHIDNCMANPQKAKEDHKRRNLEKEYNDPSGHAVNFIVHRDEYGEQHIVHVKEDIALTSD